MKTLQLISGALIAVALTGNAHSQCQWSEKAQPTTAPASGYDIVDVALEAGSFKTLVTAAAAAGLVDALKSEGPLTVFAPTDEAFGKLPAGTVDELLKPQNRDKLAAILKYHVIQGRVDRKTAVRVGRADTLLEGKSLEIQNAGSTVTVNDAKVIKADVFARNGVIHVIDSVLLPSAEEEKVTVSSARGIIELAIQRGAPLYNEGQADACAAIYEVTALSLTTLGRDLVTAEAREDLQRSIQRAKEASDASESAWILRRALDRTFDRTGAAADGSSGFQPVIEARLPSGFPMPGPVGEVVVKDYPAYRAATVTDGGRGAFMKLFRHIKSHDIAMTAPVEREVCEHSGSSKTMAFLYGEPTMGQIGADGEVAVQDREAMTVVSLGLRGRSSRGAIQDAVAQLKEWLGDQQTYVAAGQPRVFGYNSPFMPERDRYWEVQIPVTKRLTAKAESSPSGI